MTAIEGPLRKMRTELSDPVRYALPLGDSEFVLDDALGQALKLRFTGKIECINCSRSIKKSYNQGFCFPCSQRLASCDMCILKPETCHYHLGTCREPEWGEANCLRPHVVYLANSSGLKVGITRLEQVPTRWIDQGAASALPILAASTRRLSGLLEVAIAQHVSDRTDWRAMLKGPPEPRELAVERDRLLAACESELDAIRREFGADSFEILASEVTDIHYPVREYPIKVRSMNFDKLPEIEGTLLGIKGQYLILEQGVINMRRHGGYHLNVDFG